METLFYFVHGGERRGPVAAEELRRLARAGSLCPTDYVFRVGAARWETASQVDGLFADVPVAAVAAVPVAVPAVPVAAVPAGGPPPAGRLGRFGAAAAYGRRALQETWATVSGTARQAARLVRCAAGAVRRPALRRRVRRTQTALGQSLYEAGAGDPGLREQLDRLQERLRSVEAAGGPARLLRAERDGLYIRLADPFVEQQEGPAAAAEAHRAAREARRALAAHEQRQSAARTALWPAGRVERFRVGAGLVAFAVLLLVVLVRLSASASPAWAGDPAAGGFRFPGHPGGEEGEDGGGGGEDRPDGRRQPASLAFVPEDTEILYRVDVRALLSAAPAQRQALEDYARTLKDAPGVGRLLEYTGFNPLTDLDSVTVALASIKAGSAELLTIFKGKFDAAKIGAALKVAGRDNKDLEVKASRHDSWEVFEIRLKTTTGAFPAGFVAVPDGGTVLASNHRERLTDALDRARGGKLNAGLAAALARVDTREHAWLAMTWPPAIKQLVRQFGGPELPNALEAIALSGSFRDGVRVDLTVVTADGDAAREVVELLEGLKELATTFAFQVPGRAAKDLVKAIQDAPVKADGKVVTARLALDAKLLDRLADLQKKP